MRELPMESGQGWVRREGIIWQEKRQLCLLLNAENIFHSMADILLREEDLKFASTMVHTLNTILLTSSELFQLRNQLKDLKTPVWAAGAG
ncbi:hypothetical protein DV515_00008180 [Chloebia gouldiae]|uniref:Vacuolar protein 14 C-terminal Fig4-binding domain-containing protein n=1 Tax=Chloebia gouldiae TaxID=44316 RepID=A0A3L8SGP7_CHLGU|nr:hypothetical protein DV515_00008180 [Chloebia gouldiae]